MQTPNPIQNNFVDMNQMLPANKVQVSKNQGDSSTEHVVISDF